MTDQPARQADGGMRFLVFGAGAIGSYIGGSLVLHGQPVVFLERPEISQQLAQHGILLNIGGVEQRIDQPMLANSLPEALALGPYDVGIFALKSYDTQAALAGMRPYAEQLPPILCLQNGVENEAAIAAELGNSKVIAGSVTSAIGRPMSGEIILERLRGMGIAAGHSLSGRLVKTFNQARLHAKLFPSAADMKWSKMLTNLLVNASSAILDMTPAEILDHRGLYRMEIAQAREALAVMQAQGINVVDLPATPVRVLARIIGSLPPALSRPLLKRALGSGRGAKMPSFYIDLHSGRGQSEVDYLNGAVVRFGERTGVRTPANRLLTQTLVSLTRGEISREEFSHHPEKLLALWER